MYRLVDFALSNLVNAGILRIAVLTQYKSHSLDRHISTTWRMSTLLGNYVTPVPAQQRLGPHWYTGSADAIYQSLNLIYDEKPDLVIVFGADHVYRMDPRQMIDEHCQHGAGVTVAAIPVPRMEATAFGVIQAGADGHTLEAFLEKPADPPSLPGRPDEAYASMGNYLFSTDVLIEALRKDAANPNSRHDMGGDIIPMLVDEGCAHVYDFMTNKVPGASDRDAGYWRDVGTLDSYFDAHMDLCAIHPVFNLYNDRWPILTNVPSLPPAKFVHDSGDRVGRAIDSLVSNGVIVSGGLVRESVLSPGVRVNSWSTVERSVILHNTIIGRHAVIRDAILDKNVVVPEGRHDRRGQGPRPGTRLRGLRRRHHRGRQEPESDGMTVTGGSPAPARADRLRVALLTREYPPEVYGGAGVHVTYLARELAGLVDVTVHCQGGDRPGAVAHRPWDLLAGANQALATISTDLSMTAAVGGADLVHSHTWYANLAGHLASMLYGIPHVMTMHSLEPLRPWKAEQLGGGYALSSWCERVAVESAAAVIAVSRGNAVRRAGRLPRGAAGPHPGHPQRDRHPGVRPGRRDRGAAALRGGPGPAHGDLRRADHPAEGRPGAAAGGGQPAARGAARAVRRPAGHPGAGRRGDRAGDEPADGPLRGHLDPRDAVQARGDPAAQSRHRVRLPVAVRAARHRQPGGDGVRHGGGGVPGGRHS